MQTRGPRRRFWVETGLTAAALFLAVVTIVSPQWIEMIIGLDPDAGSGATEWAVASILLMVAAGNAVLAGVEWHRARLSAVTGP
jgi:hypothetical protein